MGKNLIQQKRGKGSTTYRAHSFRWKARIQYRAYDEQEKKGVVHGRVINIIDCPGHSAPLAKINYENGAFFIPAFKGMIEGQTIKIGTKEIKFGNIVQLKDVPVKTKVYCIESKPGDGGIFIKAGGVSAVMNRKIGEVPFILMPSKEEKAFNPNCRAVIGEIAGHGRQEKPFVKAGRKYHLMKTKNKLWPRTSAVKMNAIDHPFGSGRGKNPKSKVAKRNAPPGRKVGLIRPERTGRRKR